MYVEAAGDAAHWITTRPLPLWAPRPEGAAGATVGVSVPPPVPTPQAGRRTARTNRARRRGLFPLMEEGNSRVPPEELQSFSNLEGSAEGG